MEFRAVGNQDRRRLDPARDTDRSHHNAPSPNRGEVLGERANGTLVGRLDRPMFVNRVYPHQRIACRDGQQHRRQRGLHHKSLLALPRLSHGTAEGYRRVANGRAAVTRPNGDRGNVASTCKSTHPVTTRLSPTCNYPPPTCFDATFAASSGLAEVWQRPPRPPTVPPIRATASRGDGSRRSQSAKSTRTTSPVV